MQPNVIVTTVGVLAIIGGCCWFGQRIGDGIEAAYLRRTHEIAPGWLQVACLAVSGVIGLGLAAVLIG